MTDKQVAAPGRVLSAGAYIAGALLSALYYAVINAVALVVWALAESESISDGQSQYWFFWFTAFLASLVGAGIVASIAVMPVIAAAKTIARRLPRTRDQILLAAIYGIAVYFLISRTIYSGVSPWMIVAAGVAAAAGRASVIRAN